MKSQYATNSAKLCWPLVAAFFMLGATQSLAATYYISTTGSDVLGNGTTQSPYYTLSHAFSKGGGHTYVLKDGQYNYEGGTIANPPSGTATTPTIIQAEHDGKAIIDGAGVRSGVDISQTGTHHVIIEGFRLQNCGEGPAVSVQSPDGTSLANQINNITIRRTGAYGNAVNTNNNVWNLSRIRDSLFEDVWGWGAGRYVLSLYGATNVTLRRAVLRWDRWDGLAYKPGDPKFNMSLYNTHDSLVENVILLDGTTATGGGDRGGILLAGNSNGNTALYTESSNNAILGTISLNNVGSGLASESGGGINTNNRFENVVSWNNEYAVTVPKKGNNTTLNHVTLGGGSNGTYFGGSGNQVTNTSLKNSLVHNNENSGINGSVTSDYNNVYSNNPNYNGATPGTHDISIQPGLKYILRAETSSPNKGAASDGGDMGATIIKRYQNGSLTNQNLWPFPNEARIKADLCGNETRGLCSKASLTHYIWEFLGNPLPSEYADGSGSGPDTVPPASPKGLTLTIQ
ncbi:MAG TPA: hypothetical protein PKK23_02385 [Nitrospirales bacterium]|nr:hypothetical protein [Nitrospirales bacterium]